jgi:hypothetical protein
MVFDTLAIALYFGVRGVLQVWIPRGSIKIRKFRVVLGIVSLPLVTIIHLDELIRYLSIWPPSDWALKPTPVVFFLAWLIFLVTDTLYQYYRILNIPESNT